MASNNEDYLDELLRSVIDEDAPDIIDKPMLNEEELGREIGSLLASDFDTEMDEDIEEDTEEIVKEEKKIPEQKEVPSEEKIEIQPGNDVPISEGTAPEQSSDSEIEDLLGMFDDNSKKGIDDVMKEVKEPSNDEDDVDNMIAMLNELGSQPESSYSQEEIPMDELEIEGIEGIEDIKDIKELPGKKDKKKKESKFLSKIIHFFFDEAEEEEAAQPLNEENKETSDDGDGKKEKKEKKKKEKKPKKEKKEKKPKKEKKKKEKLPKVSAEPKVPEKKLPKGPVIVVFLFFLSVAAALVLMLMTIPPAGGLAQARDSFKAGDYENAFLQFSGLKLASNSDNSMYEASGIIVKLDRFLDSYQEKQQLNNTTEGLDTLLQGIAYYDSKEGVLEALGLGNLAQEKYNAIVTVLSNDYGISVEEAREILSLNSLDYTVEVTKRTNPESLKREVSIGVNPEENMENIEGNEENGTGPSMSDQENVGEEGDATGENSELPVDETAETPETGENIPDMENMEGQGETTSPAPVTGDVSGGMTDGNVLYEFTVDPNGNQL